MTSVRGWEDPSDTKELVLAASLARQMPEHASMVLDYYADDGDLLDSWLARSRSDVARAAAKRFAEVEGSSTVGRKGVGRISAEAWPRLGYAVGLKPGDSRAQAVTAAVEAVIQAGYLFALRVFLENGKGPSKTDELTEGLWEAWIPVAYRPETVIEDMFFDDSVITDYMIWLLDLLGEKKIRKKVEAGKVTDVMRSFSGLPRVGISLFVTERTTLYRD